MVDRKHAARPGHCLDLASVFWQEWLSNRKDIQPAKNGATYLQRLSPGTSYKWRKNEENWLTQVHMEKHALKLMQVGSTARKISSTTER